MAKGKAALAFAAGFGGGYLNSQRQSELDEERRADRAERQEDRARRRDAEDRETRDRVTLARAMKPATVNEGAVTLDMGDGPKVYDMPEGADVAASDSRQAVRLGMQEPVQQQTAAVNGTAYPTPESAKTAADAYNAPDAVAKRVRGADVSDPSKAITLSQSLVKEGRENTKWTQEQQEWAKKMLAEGSEETAKAMLTGDANTVFQTFNAKGEAKLKAPPTVEAVDLNLPGIGTVKNYVYKGVVVNPDGSETPFTRDSHTANVTLMKYKDLLDLQRKGVEGDSRHQARLDQMENAAKRLELQGQVAEARLLRAQAQGNGMSARDKQQARLDQMENAAKRLELQGQVAEARLLRAQAEGGGGKLAREERLLYTSLFSDAGRRMSETQKAMGTLQKDTMFMINARKPGSVEAQQLESLRNDLEAYKQDRSMYQSLLAGDKGAPSLANAEPKPGKGPGKGPAKPASKAEYDKLPPGTTYVHPDGTTRVKG